MKHSLSLVAATFCLTLSFSAMAGKCPNFTPFDSAGDSFCYTTDSVNIKLPAKPTQAQIIDYDKVTTLVCNLYSSKIKYVGGKIYYAGSTYKNVTKGSSTTLKACNDPSTCLGWSEEKKIICSSNTFRSSSGSESVQYLVNCPYSGSIISLDTCKWMMVVPTNH